MKRITLNYCGTRHTHTWRATSTRFGVSAYGRTVAEARSRLFITTNVEKSNRGLFYDGLIIGVVRDWKHPLDTRPSV